VTKSKKLRVLHEIYATIPSAGCKGLCTEACASIPVLPFELEQLEAVAGRRLPTISAGDTLILGVAVGDACPLLVMGRCSVYDQRPLICRAFGSAEGLRCPHGCRPDELVPRAEVFGAFEKVAEL